MLKKILYLGAVATLVACSNMEEAPEELGQRQPIEENNVPDSITGLIIRDIAESGIDVSRQVSAEIMAFVLESAIHDIFGTSIEGFYAEMALEEPRFDWRIFWVGRIAETEEDLENGNYAYSFRFNAGNANGLDLARKHTLETENPIAEPPSEEELEAYKATVLNHTAQFSGDYWPGPDTPVSFIELVKFEELAPHELKFNLGLNQGQEVEVIIQRGTNQILSFQTFNRTSGGAGTG